MSDLFRSSYTYDAVGRRVLVGLDYGETIEFERIDASMPYDGEPLWPGEGLTLSPREERWLELWRKHLSTHALMCESAGAA